MELAAILAAIEASCDVSLLSTQPASQEGAKGWGAHSVVPWPVALVPSICQPVTADLKHQPPCMSVVNNQCCTVHGVVLCCQGKEGSDDVQVPAELLLAAQQELKGKAQMARDLEMVRAA